MRVRSSSLPSPSEALVIFSLDVCTLCLVHLQSAAKCLRSLLGPPAEEAADAPAVLD